MFQEPKKNEIPLPGKSCYYSSRGTTDAMKKYFLLLSVMVALLSCSRGDRGKELKEASGKDSVEVPSFEIEVKLTKRAEKKLREDHETIIVQAYFLGIPTDTTRREYQEEGTIPVGSPKVELTREGVARFEGLKMSKVDFESLADKDFEVLINVYSGRRASQLNLLKCDVLQQPISKVRGQRHTLNGDLIQ